MKGELKEAREGESRRLLGPDGMRYDEVGGCSTAPIASCMHGELDNTTTTFKACHLRRDELGILVADGYQVKVTATAISPLLIVLCASHFSDLRLWSHHLLTLPRCRQSRPKQDHHALDPLGCVHDRNRPKRAPLFIAANTYIRCAQGRGRYSVLALCPASIPHHTIMRGQR